jgi:hypothetical protein
MKKVSIILLLIALSTMLIAQSGKTEAIESLDTAKSMINSGQYLKAQDELNYAQAKISEMLSEDLLKYIPDAPAGFTLNDKSSQSLGQAGAIIGSANAIAANGNYSKDDIDLDLTIAVGGLPGQTAGLMGLASMFGGMADMTSKTIRVKGYNATLEYEESDESGTLTIKVGEKISVIVEGENIEDADVLKSLAEKVDFDALKKAF